MYTQSFLKLEEDFGDVQIDPLDLHFEIDRFVEFNYYSQSAHLKNKTIEDKIIRCLEIIFMTDPIEIDIPHISHFDFSCLLHILNFFVF